MHSWLCEMGDLDAQVDEVARAGASCDKFDH